MVWVKTVIKLKYVAEKPKCEVCGHIFKEGEVAWRRVRAQPRGSNYKPTADIFRCQKCYDLMWH